MCGSQKCIVSWQPAHLGQRNRPCVPVSEPSLRPRVPGQVHVAQVTTCVPGQVHVAQVTTRIPG